MKTMMLSCHNCNYTITEKNFLLYHEFTDLCPKCGKVYMMDFDDVGYVRDFNDRKSK